MKKARRLAAPALVLLPLLSLSLVRCSGTADQGAGEDSGADASDGAPSDSSAAPDTHPGANDASGPSPDANDGQVSSRPDASDASDGGGPTDAGADASDGGGPTDAGADASDGGNPSDAGQSEAGSDSGGGMTDAGALDAADAEGGSQDAQSDGSSADAADAGCGAPSETCPGVLFLATSAAGLLGGALGSSGAWVTSPLGDSSNFPPAITVNASGLAAGVYTSSTGGAVGYTVFAGGTWSSPAAISASAVARTGPAIDGTGSSTSYAVYQDQSYKFWSLSLAGGTWSTPIPAGPPSNQSFGPVAASIASLGASATIAFIDGASPDVNWVAEADLVGGSWQAGTDLAGPESYTVSPSIIPLTAGPELLMAFVTQGAQVLSATRTSGAWSAPATVASAFTNDPVALAPLPAGGAILAFRGTDQKLYWSVFSSGAWSAVAPLASPNVSIDAPPAISHGVNGDVAEIAYVSAGVAYHARLGGSAWSSPVLVGGSVLSGVAIASVP